MLHWNIDIEDIAFVDLSTNHRLVYRHCNLFSCTSFANIFSLVVYPDDLSDPLSSTIDERILRLDDPIKHLDPDNSWITPAKHESLQQFDFSRSYEKVHLGLRASKPLSLHPSRILLENMVEDISLEDGDLR